MTESAQVFQGVHDTPVYTNFLGKPLRLWVAITAATGLTATALATVLLLDSGHARAVFVWGLLATAALAGAGALMPRTRPNAAFRLRAWRRAARPRLHSSATDALLAPPPDTIANLTFTSHGVYAHFVLTGLRYYLQPTKRRIGVAESHRSLARELPSGTWMYGLSVPQDQRQLLRAMLHGHRDKPAWIAGLPADAARPRAGQPPHPHLLVSHSGGRGPRRAQPHRTDHQGQGLARRARQRLRLLTSGLPAPRAGHHHRAARRVHADAGQRRYDRLVLAPQRIPRFIHRPAAPPS